MIDVGWLLYVLICAVLVVALCRAAARGDSYIPGSSPIRGEEPGMWRIEKRKEVIQMAKCGKGKGKGKR